MDPETRVRICRLVEAVITADGIIRPAEQDFLRRVAERFGVSFEIAEVGPVGDRGPVSDPGRASALLHELPDDTKVRVMAILVEAAITDGQVHPTEHALLLVAAAALGIDATAVEERVRERLARVNAR